MSQGSQPGWEWPGQKEWADYQKAKKDWKVWVPKVTTWKVGASGSVTKLFLERMLTVYLLSANVYRAAWKTRPGLYLAVACGVGATGYDQFKKRIEDKRAAENKRQLELEKRKNDARYEELVATLKKDKEATELRAKEIETQQKKFETTVVQEYEDLKKDHVVLKQKFEESQQSFFANWWPWRKNK